MSLDIPLSSVFHFAVLIAMFFYFCWILIVAGRYVKKCMNGGIAVAPAQILKYIVMLLVGLSIGWLLLGALKYDQRITTPIKKSGALPGGVTEHMIRESTSPNPEDLAEQRQKRHRLKAAQERGEETNQQKLFKTDLDNYRKSMGLDPNH